MTHGKSVVVPVIRLTTHEVQSGHDRQKWADGLIRQLPEDHDGRNSWLINYGETEEASDKRNAWNDQARKDGREPSCVFNEDTRSTGTAAPAPSSLAGGDVTDEWADRFCEAVNWSPDGQECKTVEGELRCTTFRQIAKGHILSAIATNPYPDNAALSPEAPAREPEGGAAWGAAIEAAAKAVERQIPDAAGGPMSHTNTARVFLFDAVKAIRALTPRHEAPAEGAGSFAGSLAVALEDLSNAAEVVRRMLHNSKEHQNRSYDEAGIPFVTAINRAKLILKDYDRARSSAPEDREGDQAVAGVKALAFFKWARDFFWCEDGCEIDGGDFQDAAERFGLIVKVPFDPERHADNGYGLEAGDDWYETEPAVELALSTPDALKGDA